MKVKKFTNSITPIANCRTRVKRRLFFFFD
jgi:hypothetical protein